MRLGTTAYLLCYRVAHGERVAVQLASTRAMPAEHRASFCHPFPRSSTAGFALKMGAEVPSSIMNFQNTRNTLGGDRPRKATHLTPTPALSVMLQSTRLPYALAQCVPTALASA